MNNTSRVDIGIDEQWKFIRRDVAGAEAPGFDDAAWQAVNLPHTWNNLDGQDGGDDYYRGVGWYRRPLTVDAQHAGKSLFLKFDGAATVADVFINGKRVGAHAGNFAAFCFDVTSFLHVGKKNVIAVKVNNAKNPEIAPLSGDFTIFGGLYRPAHLLVLDKLSISPLDYASPGVYIKQVRVTADSAELEITSKLRNANDAAKTATVRCAITDANGKSVASIRSRQEVPANGGADTVQTLTLVQPHLWNGRADPYLYQVTVEVSDGDRVVDSVLQPLGVRFFRVDPNEGFFLNGQRFALHGVNRHQDRLDKGWAIGPAEHEEDFNLILELGCTGVRLAHYQQAQYFYDLCDRGGLVVWAELCLVNELGASKAFSENARQQLTELVKQNFNHSSIAFWGVYNELHSKTSWVEAPAAWGLIPELNKLVKQLDPTRLSTAAASINPEEPLNLVTDTLAFNRYPGWYFGAATDWPAVLDDLRRKLPGTSVGIGEYGAGASIHQHEINPQQPKTDGPWHPEEWQCVIHEVAWKAMNERPWLWCTFIWNMFDFAVDNRNEGDHPGRNDKGLITYDRKVKKDAFYWYKVNWTTELVVYITSRRFTQRVEPETPVKIYSNCDEVELKVNGVTRGSVRSEDCIFLWKEITLKPGNNFIMAIGSKGGKSFTDSCSWTYRPGENK